MIETRQGNALDLQRGILVHGCNCQGVMGGGFAKFLRDKYSAVYDTYICHMDTIGLHLGDVSLVSNLGSSHSEILARHGTMTSQHLPTELVVVNAMTQFDCQHLPGTRDVDYDAVTAAFARIKLIARDTGLPVHFPMIGCGLAGGEWTEVGPRIEAALGPDIEAVLWVLPS